MPTGKIISERQCFSRIGAAYFAMITVSVMVQVILVLLITLIYPALLENADSYLFLMMISMYLLGAPICIALLRRVPATRRPEQRRMGMVSFLKWMLISIGVCNIGNLVSQIFMVLVQGLMGQATQNPLEEMMMEFSPHLILFYTGLLAPLIEELLFRKLLIDRVRPFGDRVAILLSGTLFGLFHGNFYQFFYAAALGMLFAYLYIHTGRLRYPVALHMAINIWGGNVLPGVVNYAIEHIEEVTSVVLLLLASGVSIAATVIGLVLFVRTSRGIKLQPGVCPLQRGSGLRTVLLNAGMLLLLASCIFEFYVSLV